jgi:hypothetical protein
MFSTSWFSRYHVCYDEGANEDSLALDRVLLEEMVEFVRSSDLSPLQQDFFLFYGFDLVPFRVLFIGPVDAETLPVALKIKKVCSLGGPF